MYNMSSSNEPEKLETSYEILDYPALGSPFHLAIPVHNMSDGIINKFYLCIYVYIHLTLNIINLTI